MQTVEEVVKEEGMEFARVLMKQRIAKLSKKKSISTGNLIKSFKVEEIRAAGDEAFSVAIAFSDSGRFIDMRPTSIHYKRGKGGNDFINNLANWITRNDSEKFIANWMKKRGITSTKQSKEAIINSIAFGIAMSRTEGKFKRTVWWNKAKTASIANLVNDLAAKLPLTAKENIVNAFQNN